MECRLNVERMISHLFLNAKKQMMKLENTMLTLHANCKGNEFTGLIRHLDGTVF